MDRTIGDLAFLYITFAHATDGALTGEEMRTLAAQLRQWQPDADLDAIGEHIRKAVESYKQLGNRDERIAKAGACADGLAKSLGAADRATVLAQLKTIAEADGAITAEEESFLAEIGQRLGL